MRRLVTFFAVVAMLLLPVVSFADNDKVPGIHIAVISEEPANCLSENAVGMVGRSSEDGPGMLRESEADMSEVAQRGCENGPTYFHTKYSVTDTVSHTFCGTQIVDRYGPAIDPTDYWFVKREAELYCSGGGTDGSGASDSGGSSD